jgi:hypothetical protein
MGRTESGGEKVNHNITPVELEFLLHCYYSPAPYTHYHSLLDPFIERMLNEGILVRQIDRIHGGTYRVTERGKVWVEHILNTPFPVQSWARGSYE